MVEIYKDKTLGHAKQKTIKVKLPGWAKRIDEAEKRGFYNQQDKDKAGDWRVCLCGERALLDEAVNTKDWRKSCRDKNYKTADGKPVSFSKIKNMSPNMMQEKGIVVTTTGDMLTRRASVIGGNFPKSVENTTPMNFDNAREKMHQIENMQHLVKAKYRQKDPNKKPRKKRIKPSQVPLP